MAIRIISYLILMKALFIAFLIGLFFGACGQTPYPTDSLQLNPTRMFPPPSHTWRQTMESQLMRLQSENADELGYTVYEIATTWAAAGFIEQANQLLTLFWDYKITDPNSFEHINDGFSVMWALSGKHPAHIPFGMKSIDEIVRDNWDGQFNLFPGARPALSESIESRSWKELSGPALLAKATSLSCDARAANHRGSRQSQQEAVLAFSKYFTTETPVGYGLSHDAGIAAMVSAGVGDEGSTEAFIQRWGRGYLQYPANYMLADLMKDTATARYLLRGILAPVWGITESSCTADLQRVKALLAERMKNGPSLVFGQLKLIVLLRRLSDSAIRQNDIDYDDAVTKRRWLGYPSAKPDLIKATEKRLGVNLPEDYKAFLLVSNGFRATGSTSVSFLPVERIGRLRDLDSEMVNILGNPLDENDSARADGFRRSILIGGLSEEQQFLLVPPSGVDKEWKYWFFAAWLPGERAYPSLRFYLEYELQFMMRR